MCDTADYWNDEVLPLTHHGDQNEASQYEVYRRSTLSVSSYDAWIMSGEIYNWIYYVERNGEHLSPTEMEDWYTALVSVTGYDGGVTLPHLGMGVINIDMTDAPDGAGWVRSPGTTVPETTGVKTFVDVPDDYSLTYRAVSGYSTPSAEGPFTLTEGGEITFGPPDYVPD
jgi:hypothetical protein